MSNNFNFHNIEQLNGKWVGYGDGAWDIKSTKTTVGWIAHHQMNRYKPIFGRTLKDVSEQLEKIK